MNNQRKIIWPGGETEKPQGFQMSTRLKVGCLRSAAAMWQSLSTQIEDGPGRIDSCWTCVSQRGVKLICAHNGSGDMSASTLISSNVSQARREPLICILVGYFYIHLLCLSPCVSCVSGSLYMCICVSAGFFQVFFCFLVSFSLAVPHRSPSGDRGGSSSRLRDKQLSVPSVVDSDDTPGAICVCETHSAGWNMPRGNDIKWSLN